jgi:endonuclease V-like protein UPF0215 family
MKDQIRVLGIDDGPFKFKAGKVPIIGVIIRPPNYIEGICRSEVTIDGSDANESVKNMVKNSAYKDQIRLIMFDGVALGGFNVIDIESIYQSLGIPIVTISRTEPNMVVIKDALKKHFSDWKYRWNAINKLDLIKINTNFNPIFIKFVGTSLSEITRSIKLTTVQGVLPEPIRVAHLIASALVKGESYGKA